MRPADRRGGGGEGAGKGAPLSGALILAVFLAQILAIYFHRKGGKMTTFLTALDALIPKMPFAFF